MMSTIEKMAIVDLIEDGLGVGLVERIHDYGQSLLETQKLAHLEIVNEVGEAARKTENLYSGFSAAVEIEKRMKKHGI